MNWKIWVKGLIAATISGAANSGLAAGIAPESFNFGDGLNKLITMCAGGAIIGVLLYLKQSPFPADCEGQK